MLTYRQSNGAECDEFLRLLREEAADYLDRTISLMGMSWADFARIMQTVGHVFSVQEGPDTVGFYWIEERGRIVHLHGLAVKGEFQGRGIGTAILHSLIARRREPVDAIELGVHDSNVVARSLYEKLGFTTVKRLDDLGFSIMQLHLDAENKTKGGQDEISNRK